MHYNITTTFSTKMFTPLYNAFKIQINIFKVAMTLIYFISETFDLLGKTAVNNCRSIILLLKLQLVSVEIE